MSAITTLGRSIPADRTAGKRGQIAQSIGHEPALDPNGQPETPERYLGQSFDHIVTVCDGTADT